MDGKYKTKKLVTKTFSSKVIFIFIPYSFDVHEEDKSRWSHKPIDLKKRFVLKRTKAQKGARMARKARFTKRFNPASKAVQRMNKAMRR